MNSIVARIDAWCRRGDLTLDDIALFRIIYSAGVLLTLQPLGVLTRRPPERFDPPPGPMMVFESLPPHAVLEGLEFLTVTVAALLLLGLHTRAMSIMLGLALMTGFGLTFSYGNTSHTILLVVVPFVMAFSAWGDARSVDAFRGRRDSESGDVAQWPMRFLAVMIALAFATAGLAKLMSGWLDPGTHAVQGHFVRSYYKNRRKDWLAPEVIDLHLGRLWEAVDWFTVALELGLLIAVLWWRSFRVAIAIATLFHLGILLMMNIEFSWNILAYAAFVRWGLIVGWKPRIRVRPSLGYAVALTIGTSAYYLHEGLGPQFQRDVRTALIFLGGASGAIYLAYLAVQFGALVRTPRATTRT